MRRRVTFFILTLGAFLFSAGEAAAVIDLTAKKMYVREGFEKSWTTDLPGDEQWKSIPGTDTGSRSIRIRELGLPGVPDRTFLSPFSVKPREFTFVTSFKMSRKERRALRVPGLYLKRIAFNWEIYLNGRVIKREWYLNADGIPLRLRNNRDMLVDINPLYLKEGRNILAFRILGDPTHINTGFLSGGPYVIDEYIILDEKRSETAVLIFVFIYLFMGFYHLILFYNRRAERHNLYFGLMIIAVFFYFLARTWHFSGILPDAGVTMRIELVSLFLLLPLAQHFFDFLLRRSISIASRVTLVVYGILSILVLPFSLSFSDDVLRVWQVTALFPLGYIVGTTIYHFVMKVKDYLRDNEAEENRIIVVLKMMGTSEAGNLLVGVIIVAFTTVFDIIDAIFFHYDIVLSRYSFFLVIVGMTVMLANRFIYVYNRIEVLNRRLKEKVDDLNRANSLISFSEEKYRLLVEGSNEIIFSLDDDCRLIDANRALKDHLQMDPDKVPGLDILQLVYDGHDQATLNSEFVKKKLEELQRKKKPVRFKTEFISRMMKEPVAMQVSLQYIGHEGKEKIVGRATREMEDNLLKYFVTEKQQYRIENILVTADEVSRRLTRNLVRFCSQRDTDFMRLALREIIVNAIEHGNLEVTFEEKSSAMIEGNYIELIEKRQQEAPYRDRRVTIEYLVNPRRAVYVVVDEGKGFDYEHTLSDHSRRANSEMLAHGRGIVMAGNIFDSVTFSGRGNHVRLEKKFS